MLSGGCTNGKEQRSASAIQNEGFVTAGEESPEQEEIQLYYRMLSAGEDTLLVVHGGPGAGMYTILPDTRGLADRFTLLYYDQRGGGRSSLPADTALLGTLVLAEYARRFPDRLRRIVLLGPTAPSRDIAARRYRSAGGNGEPQPDSSLLRRYRTVLTSLLDGSAEQPREACRECERLGDRIAEARGDTSASWHGTECRAPAEVVRYYFHRTAQIIPRSFGAWEYTNALGEVEAPALIVHGGLDSLGLVGSRAWANTFPRGEFFVVPGVHRGAIADRPDLVQRAIASFIASGRISTSPTPPE